jgi:hypothetical protein
MTVKVTISAVYLGARSHVQPPLAKLVAPENDEDSITAHTYNNAQWGVLCQYDLVVHLLCGCVPCCAVT